MLRRSYVASLVALAVLIGACGSSDKSGGPSLPTHDGTWSGYNAGITLTATLDQAGSQVTGNGNFASTTASFAVTIVGTYVHPNVALTMSSPGFEDVNFSGAFTDNDSIAGTLNGSGFNGFAITLNKN
jgi:hypothetical protein